MKIGADGLEFDVQLTSDGLPVVIHDYDLKRTTTGQGMVKDFKVKELKKLDAGSWFNSRFTGLSIPTLDEVFSRYRAENILFNIELKTDTNQSQALEKTVLETIDKYNLIEQVVISSFDHDSLVTCLQLEPAIRTGMLYIMDIKEPWKLALSLGCYSVHPLFSYLESAEMLNSFKEHNLALFPWTVNNPDIMSNMINHEVQGIITDYPQELKKIIAE